MASDKERAELVYCRQSLLGLDTRTTYVMDYTAAEGNQTVHYIVPWIGANSRRRVGTWSETVSPKRDRDSKSSATVCP
jgi:hypothetical protein